MITKFKFCTYTLLLTFLIASCAKSTADKSNDEKLIDQFPISTSLSSKPVKDIKIITEWANLVVVDTFLIVHKQESPFIHIYSTNNHKLLGKIGESGDGPNEFKLPDFVKLVSRDTINNSPVVTLYDVIRRRFSKVNILKAINGEKDAIVQEPIKAIDDFLADFYHKDDSLLLAKSENDGRFVIHNYTTSKTKYVSYVPAFELDLKNSDKFQMVQIYSSADAIVNKEKNRFVTAPLLLNELQFFDLQGNAVSTTIMESRTKIAETLKPLPNGSLKSDVKRYISSIEQVDDKLYALNEDMEADQRNNARTKNPMKMQIFDWDGNPIKEYVFEDKRNITSIAYDKIHRQFYAYVRNEEEYNIFIYPANQ